MPPNVGRRFSQHYQIISILPSLSGGIGESWLALDTLAGRDVMITKLPRSLGGSIPRRMFLFRHARLLGSLRHPHLADIYDIIGEGETGYLISEYSKKTLRGLVEIEERVPLSGPIALNIILQIATALVAAEATGVVHGPILLDQILLSENDHVRVAGFDLYRHSTLDTPVIAYQETLWCGEAPELREGSELSTSADIYALGALLFLLLSGQGQFVSDPTSYDVTAQRFDLQNSQPRLLHNVLPQIDRELASFVDACLNHDPARRPEGGQSLLNTLRHFEVKLAVQTAVLSEIKQGTATENIADSDHLNSATKPDTHRPVLSRLAVQAIPPVRVVPPEQKRVELHVEEKKKSVFAGLPLVSLPPFEVPRFKERIVIPNLNFRQVASLRTEWRLWLRQPIMRIVIVCLTIILCISSISAVYEHEHNSPSSLPTSVITQNTPTVQTIVPSPTPIIDIGSAITLQVEPTTLITRSVFVKISTSQTLTTTINAPVSPQVDITATPEVSPPNAKIKPLLTDLAITPPLEINVTGEVQVLQVEEQVQHIAYGVNFYPGGVKAHTLLHIINNGTDSQSLNAGTMVGEVNGVKFDTTDDVTIPPGDKKSGKNGEATVNIIAEETGPAPNGAIIKAHFSNDLLLLSDTIVDGAEKTGVPTPSELDRADAEKIAAQMAQNDAGKLMHAQFGPDALIMTNIAFTSIASNPHLRPDIGEDAPNGNFTLQVTIAVSIPVVPAAAWQTAIHTAFAVDPLLSLYDRSADNPTWANTTMSVNSGELFSYSADLSFSVQPILTQRLLAILKRDLANRTEDTARAYLTILHTRGEIGNYNPTILLALRLQNARLPDSAHISINSNTAY